MFRAPRRIGFRSTRVPNQYQFLVNTILNFRLHWPQDNVIFILKFYPTVLILWSIDVKWISYKNVYNNNVRLVYSNLTLFFRIQFTNLSNVRTLNIFIALVFSCVMLEIELIDYQSDERPNCSQVVRGVLNKLTLNIWSYWHNKQNKNIWPECEYCKTIHLHIFSNFLLCI